MKGGYNWVINQLITGGHHPVAPLRYYPGLTPYKVFHNDSPDVSQASLGPMSLVQACAGMVNAIAFETSETLVSHVTGAVSKVGTAKIQLRRWGRKLHSCLMFARGCGHCHRDLWWLMFRREKNKKVMFMGFCAMSPKIADSMSYHELFGCYYRWGTSPILIPASQAKFLGRICLYPAW